MSVVLVAFPFVACFYHTAVLSFRRDYSDELEESLYVQRKSYRRRYVEKKRKTDELHKKTYFQLFPHSIPPGAFALSFLPNIHPPLPPIFSSFTDAAVACFSGLGGVSTELKLSVLAGRPPPGPRGILDDNDALSSLSRVVVSPSPEPEL